MNLYIDTSDSEKLVIGLGGQKWETEARKNKSQILLSLIDEKLKELKKNPKDLTEIEVNLGPGSFTGLRVGISVANTMGWILNIPVNHKNISHKNFVEPIYVRT